MPSVTLLLEVPQGLNNLAHQNAVYHQAEPDRMGSSGGLLSTSMYVAPWSPTASRRCW